MLGVVVLFDNGFVVYLDDMICYVGDDGVVCDDDNEGVEFVVYLFEYF